MRDRSNARDRAATFSLRGRTRLPGFTITAVIVALGAITADAARTLREVIFSSECSCENDVGVARWRAKTDPADPPKNPREILAITPSEIFAWQGPGAVPWGGGRVGNEWRWYALTGRVISVQAENDGDVHLVLTNAYDDNPGKVIAEVPLGARWCALRTTAFSWTNAVFPFTTNGQFSPFRLVQKPVITIIGRAFYDTDHAGKDHRNNRRPRDKEKAVWEIHPVMAMSVVQEADERPAAAVRTPSSAPLTTPSPVIAPPTVPPEQFVTIVTPVTIKVAYGQATLQPGMKLPVFSRDATTVRVRYLDGIETIPLSATDMR